jgi:outer membrane protein TolC
LELLRAQGQESTAKGALASALASEENARYALLRLLGLDLDAMPVLTDSLSLTAVAPSAAPDSLGAAARPEIAAAESRRAAAQAEMGALRSEFFPTVDLFGDYGLSGRRLNERAEWTETIAVQLNWTLWDGGRRKAKLSEQAEKLRQADLSRGESRQSAREEIRSSATAMKALREVAGYALERVKMAEEEERLAREKFRTGASGNLEVISAQASVSQAHQAYIDALFGYNRARLEYLRAAHRLSEI